jgi:nitrate/nitrite-specific signal transduction histidine kinase
MLLLFSSGVAATADTLNHTEAINVAGRQRMLTQRITKSYLQIGLGANAERSKRRLLEAIDLFETQHELLKAYAPNNEVRSALVEIDSVWPDFRRSALAPPDDETALRLAALDERLLEMCETVVYLIEDIASGSYARLVNTAGRQRMLSQRLAKYYMLLASNLARPSTLAKLDRASNEFKGALHTLKSAPENSVGINERLEEVSEQWVWMDSSLKLQDDGYYPLIVEDASEKILKLMDAVTGSYARLDSGT